MPGTARNERLKTAVSIDFDLPLDDVGLTDRRRRLLIDEVRRQVERGICASLILEHAERGPTAMANVEPVVRHKAGGRTQQRHKLFPDGTVECGAGLRIERVLLDDRVDRGLRNHLEESSAAGRWSFATDAAIKTSQ